MGNSKRNPNGYKTKVLVENHNIFSLLSMKRWKKLLFLIFSTTEDTESIKEEEEN